MHPIARLSVNDSNNNSIGSNKENARAANNTPIRLHDGCIDTIKSKTEMESCDNVNDFSEGGHSLPLVVDKISRTPSPTDLKIKAVNCLRRPSTLVSPSSSIASHSPSPDTNIVVENDSSETRFPANGTNKLPKLFTKSSPVSKPRLSFGIDRILGNSNSKEVSEDFIGTERTGRDSYATGIISTDRRSKQYLARHGSISDDADEFPDSPGSSAPSPSRDDPNDDQVDDRLAKDSPLEEGTGNTKDVPTGFSVPRPVFPRPLVDNFRFPGTGNGHLVRPGFQDLMATDLSGAGRNLTNGPPNPYHNPGMFLPPRPPSELNRIEQHSTPSLSSLDLLPVRPILPDVFVCPWTGVQRDRFGLVRRIGHPYQNRTPPKRKKPRTAFTRQQVLELEKRFSRQKYLASAERSSLAKSLGMSDAQVKTWFQNRRTKWRRQTAEEREIERQAAHKFLLSLRPDDPPRPLPFTGTPCVSICPPVAPQPGRLQPQAEAASVQEMGLS